MTNEEGVVDAKAGSGEQEQTKILPAESSDNNQSFLRAARAGNIEKILEYLKGSIDINTSNANGLSALHLASKEGHAEIVTELAKKGANVNSATKKGNTPLHIASLAGQEEVAKALIKNGANVNVQSQNGFTPLYMAAQENHDAVVKFLLANGANQSLATEDGFTPLAVALQQGHDKVVAVLLENDAKGKVRLPALHIAAKKDDCKAAALLLQNAHDPDVTSKSGFTPLHIAAHYGNENIATLLLEKNADVNFSAKHQITPLHVAAKWGKSNMVILLVDKGAKIDASTRDGLTPLHCAARSGHDQVVDLLLEKGAPITAKTKNGLAPLHMASQGDHVDSARILLYHKAPVDDVTVDYLTALHVAAHCGHVRVAKLLLDRKADPNARALNGFTPLHIACKKNRIKVVELLLKHGASIEATTESGLTPLHVASFMGCMNIVIYLIQHGANPDVPTVRGETPLHLAARATQSDIIRILLRNGAHVDASAREQQTPLHIAARLGNVDIVGLLLQHGAAVDATTKDMYTALHIAAKEGQEEVASVLLDHGASLTATTKKGFTPLHLAAKYGNIKVARLLLQKDAPVDAQGKNGVTPLHVAAHYNHVNVALLLLDKGAFPHATAKNGYTPLHIVAKKNQMDIATTLLEYGAKPNAESKAGFTPLHLAAQEGHTDMTTLLIEHHADVNAPAKNGLTPLHLCAQEDKVNVAAVLVKNGAKIDPPTKAGYTPLHVACHFGQINMIRFLLQHGADVNATTSHGYTPLHQAAQQGHTLIINLLLEHKASPNTTTNQGQTALSIAQRLGYISVVETLKIVTETIVTTTTTTVTEEKYKVVAPETMQETFMSDSEDEGGDDIEDTSLYGKPAHATHVYLPYIEGQKLLMTEDTMLGDQSLHYMTTDELKALADDNTLGIDVTRDERGTDSTLIAPLTAEEDHLTPQHVAHQEATFSSTMAPDNVDLSRAPVHAGFLVSFMVDARGGAMRGCRHSGVRVIIPPRRAPMPMRITCRYLRKEKLAYPPPLMEGEACASRILEVGPSGAKFLGPVIIEVPHFASLRGREREITILRSDNGETWREHTLEASDDAVHDVFNESFEGEELTAREHLSTDRITRILTTDFPQYFAIITRIRQEVHIIGPEGGMVSSTVVPQVQAIFPERALTKKIKVGLQAQPITPELVTKLLGNRVAVSPILTVEPRRRKFHKPITLTIPVPQAATKGMINQYSGDAPTLRLLCSITGGTTKAQWEDVTGSTPLTFVNDCVSFTTTVSARFWLIDCRQVNDAVKFATELYREAIHVPFMAKFVVFAKRHDPLEAQLRVFCMTDDKEDKTLESQEHFTEVAKSRDVEVLEGKLQYLEFAGNLVPVTKSGEQLSLTFQAFRENRLPFTIRVKDPHQEPMGRVAFMREPRVGRGEPPQSPICNLNIVLPEADLTPVSELVTLEKKYGFVKETSLAKPELIHRADLRLSDIAKELKEDWVLLALQLDLSETDINSIRSDHPNDSTQQALIMLRHWLQKAGSKATGNLLEKGLRKINREDIVNNCMFNVELVTDDVEKAVAKVHLDQSGFDAFKEELGSSRDASLRRDTSLNGTYDEQDIMKDAESAAETSSESSDKDAHLKGDKHGESRRDGKIVNETVVRPCKVFEEATPETLVQSVPSALSDAYCHTINGQIFDASVHEEDQSEPTVATLSSEATAELDVSSLEDKSQGETHVEKKAQPKCAASTKFYYKQSATNKDLKFNNKETPRNVKLYKQMKKNANSNVVKRKTISNFYAHTIPPPLFRQRKLVTRRNSWPPVLPLKLTRRKKYHELIKVKDFQEPFWMNSYEWLTMRCAPEKFKIAPLAKLTEFVEDPITLYAEHKKFAPNFNSVSNSNENVAKIFTSEGPSKLSFYFVINNKLKMAIGRRKYLENLKSKCFVGAIPNLKPTNFDNFVSNEKILDSGKETNYRPESFQNKIIQTEIKEAIVNLDDDYLISESNVYDVNIGNIENKIYDSFEEAVRPISITNSRNSLRPLQNFNNTESNGNILTCITTPNFHDNYVKQKMCIRENFGNKENLKISNVGFSKFSENIEKSKRHIMGQSGKKSQKGMQSFIPVRDKNYFTDVSKLNKSCSPSREFHTVPKNTTNKNNKEDLTLCSPQDMDSDPNKSNKADTPSNKNSTSTSSSISPKCSSTVSDSPKYESSSIDSNQDNKSYTPQMVPDIQSNISESFENNETQNNDKSKSCKDVKKEENTKSVELNIKTSEKYEEMPIPASVLGQTFINTLIEQIKTPSTVQSSVPATVIGQSFLKTLQEQSSLNYMQDKPIPAEVIGQSFIKNLLSNQDISKLSIDKGDMKKVDVSEPAPFATENILPSSTKKGPISSTIVGQEFLKSLLHDAEALERKPDESKVVPASVISQSFLKSLIEQNPVQQPGSKDAIPASVVSQAFLKDLIEASIERKTDSSKIVSSGQSADNTKAEETSVIPAPVVGQIFLKSLLSEANEATETKTETTVPSSVLAQIFLKSLMSSESQSVIETTPDCSDQGNKTDACPQDSSNATVLPTSIVDETVLKSSAQEQTRQESVEKPIPSSVLSQMFLKALKDSETSVQTCKENVIPASVISQSFLKSLISECPNVQEVETPIPAPVIGQVFLKSLLQEGLSDQLSDFKEKQIPSSVVSQTFLKSLLEETSSEKAPKESQLPLEEKPIQSAVLGQIFLKSLIEQMPDKKETSEELVELSEEKQIPSSVLGQIFLKSLIEHKSEEVSKELLVPSDVVVQTSLKSGDDNVDQQSNISSTCTTSTEPNVDYVSKSTAVIPASVVEQAFLSTLLSQTSQPIVAAEKEPIPASVIGLTFLKTLTEQTVSTSEASSSDVTVPQTDSKSIPANVVGQAFLKTLFTMSDINTSPISQTPEKMSNLSSSTELEKSSSSNGNGCLNGCSTSSNLRESSIFSDEQSTIIPPPPEFSGESAECNVSALCSSSSQTTSTSNVNLPSNIIEELLSCTKVMQSVIESMKETDTDQSGSDIHPSVSDIVKKE